MSFLQKAWIRVRSSLWFVPSIMAAFSIGLAIFFIELDSGVKTDLAAKWPRIFGAGAEGARGILQAIAGSMITVTGVVFSVVIVALSLASNQYTPRILRNFMGDKGTQLVLGVFVSIFVYCLMVMRTINGGDDSFIPGLSVVTAIILALIGIGFLIYFIHHIAESIQASSIIATIARETLKAIDAAFPENKPEQVTFDANAQARCQVINCKRNGYLQTLSPRLKEFARKHEVVLRIEVQIGEFTMKDTPLVSILGSREICGDAVTDLQEFFIIDDYRTVEHDPAYGIRQLVDIALKALSPSLNDNATAACSLDYIGAILNHLVRREDPARIECEEGKPLVIQNPVDVHSMIDKALMEIRASASGNASIIGHILRIIDSVLDAAKKGYKRTLFYHVDLLQEAVSQTIQSIPDQQHLQKQILNLRAKHAPQSEAGAP